MTYFLISNGDGDTYVQQYTQEELLERISHDEGFLKEIKDCDTNYWGGVPLIIKGEIVIPRPIETVTKLTID